MPVDLSQWTGALALPEIEDTPATPLAVKYEPPLEIDELGKVLTPTQVQNPPTCIEWEGCESSKMYTLALTDPDAPNRENPNTYTPKTIQSAVSRYNRKITRLKNLYL